MDNPETLSTKGTLDEDKKINTQHNMCSTTQYAKKHK
jgi:hypothetical protein